MGIKRIIKKCFADIALMSVKFHLLPRKIIIKMDGGICSQMHFYLVGTLLSEQGNSVCYDLRWFDVEGTDLDGRFCRNFDLLKMFPGLDFKKCGKILRQIYISAFYRRNNYFDDSAKSLEWTETHSPAYLDGYFRDPEEIYSNLFRKVFRADTDVLDNRSRQTLTHIRNVEKNGKETCAVHVRRGDLSSYNSAYGDPASIGYFRESINAMSSATRDITFFLFSDEPDWCKENLLPCLGQYDIHICDTNGSDKGYCDLILMSKCRHQITSQGSMGKYAALLREEKDLDGLVTLPGNEGAETWLGRYKRAIIIRSGEDKAS